MQFLQASPTTAGFIEDSVNIGTIVVGGTSAGMATLGSLVYTAKYTQGPGATDLKSHDILTNFATSEFWQAGNGDAISPYVLHLDLLDGILTETHVNDPANDTSTDSDPAHNIHRLGRLFEFLGTACSMEVRLSVKVTRFFMA